MRTWIYGFISVELTKSILDPTDKAIDMWNRLVNKFQNNKTTRILTLEFQFKSFHLSRFSSVKSYCSEIKNIIDGLCNVSSSDSDSRLSLQVLHGLTEDYRSFRSTVQHMNPLLDFDTTRSMIELEEQTHNKETPPNDTTLLVSDSLLSRSPSSDSRQSSHSGNHGRRSNHRGGKGSRQLSLVHTITN